MQARDWMMAVFGAVILMALGVAATFGWVAIYSHVIDPGHPVEVYQAYANKYAPWIGVYAGAPLWFLTGWLIARSRERARAIDTAFGMAFVYAALDFAILSAMGSYLAYVGIVIISISTKALAAVFGALLGANAKP
jgi:hypothetical protein